MKLWFTKEVKKKKRAGDDITPWHPVPFAVSWYSVTDRVFLTGGFEGGEIAITNSTKPYNAILVSPSAGYPLEMEPTDSS